VALLAFDPLARIIAMRIDTGPPFSALLTLWLSTKFSWWWPTVWRTSRQFGSNRGKRTFDTR